MNTKQNLHTHCTYCDGRNTIEEMIVSAKEHGLSSLGFSSHCFTGFEKDLAQIDASDVDDYLADIEKYGNKYGLPVFKGFELESHTATGPQKNKDPRLDYAIGSVHWYYHRDGSMYCVDATSDIYQNAVEAFGGEKPLMENYYTEVVEFSARSNYDIVGHFDLPLKFDEQTDMSFVNKLWYKDLVLGAAEAVAKNGKIFEVNTGAIARGYRSSVYPSDDVLHLLLQLGTPIIVSSDSHACSTITFAFEETEQMLRRLGFKSQVALSGRGFIQAAL